MGLIQSQEQGCCQDSLSIHSHQCFFLSQLSVLLENATFFPEKPTFDISSLHFNSHLKIPRKGVKSQRRSYASSCKQRGHFCNWQPPLEQYSLNKEKSSSSERRTVLFPEGEWCCGDQKRYFYNYTFNIRNRCIKYEIKISFSVAYFL